MAQSPAFSGGLLGSRPGFREAALRLGVASVHFDEERALIRPGGEYSDL
jgi:hypothetical protein